MSKNNIFKLVICIIVCLVAGVVGSFFTTPSIPTWYAGLNKPSFNPPSWLFGPVWTTLFVLMGVSLYIVWEKKFEIKNELKFPKGKRAWNKWSQDLCFGKKKKLNIVLIFWLQLILNTLWSITFFGMQNPGLAFFELLMLWFAILYTIINFWRVSKPASYLLLPYILWVTFAGVLNFSLWLLNI